MAYATKTREMVFEYLAKGHTYEETRKELGVAVSTIKNWKRLKNETGSLEKRPLERSAKKFHEKDLENYVKEHFDEKMKKPVEVGTEIVYIDECGVDKFMGRLYGRSKRGKRVYLSFSRSKI
jgi:transposase